MRNCRFSVSHPSKFSKVPLPDGSSLRLFSSAFRAVAFYLRFPLRPLPSQDLHALPGFQVTASIAVCPTREPVLQPRLHLLVDMVMEEFEESRRRRRVRVNVKMKLETGELIEKRHVVQELQKGRLLEFNKDTDRILLAVAQKPDGKKNWMVSDQNGVVLSIKPQQITYIVPGIENFEHTDISSFIEKAQNNMDPALLEFAWIELLEKNKSVTAEELAEMIFGCTDPLECYCAHLLLSKDEL